MKSKYPAELMSEIRSVRFMTRFIAVCGAITLIGLPWTLYYAIFDASLSGKKLPNRKYVVTTAMVTLTVCWCILPIFLEIGLWRLAGKIEKYEKSGNKEFQNDKEWVRHRFVKRYFLASSMAGLVVFLAIMITPLPHTQSELTSIHYKTQYVQDSGIELGDSEVRQQGSDGQGYLRKHVVKPVAYFIFGSNRGYSSKNLPTQITEPPINKIVARGTMRYQYMWCSNGTYRYYSNDQFKDPNTGFTHKSPDGCAKNGEGHMTNLSDSAPPQPQTIYEPSPAPIYTPPSSPSYLNPTHTTCRYDDLLGSVNCDTY